MNKKTIDELLNLTQPLCEDDTECAKCRYRREKSKRVKQELLSVLLSLESLQEEEVPEVENDFTFLVRQGRDLLRDKVKLELSLLLK